MLQETTREIDTLNADWIVEQEQRYWRRNRIRHIDVLLNDFERLNLADETVVPIDLLGRVQRFFAEEAHALVRRPVRDVAIPEWMEALYEVQDLLMLPMKDALPD